MTGGRSLLTLAAAAATLLVICGCDRDNNNTNTARNPNATDTNAAADRAQRAADRTADDTRNAGERAADGVKELGRETGQTLKDAGQTVRDAVTPGSSTTRPATGPSSEAPDAEGIRDVVASAAEAAMTKGGFDDLVERFAKADRDHVVKFAKQKLDDLDGRIAQLRKTWHDKYGQDFDIKNEDLVYADWSIMQSQIGGAANAAANANARVAGERDATPATGAAAANRPIDASDRALQPHANDVAVVTIPGSHGMPALAVPMVHESPDNWKIDVADAVDGQKLHDNLLAHLTYLGDNTSQWPSDVNDAFRMLTHHVMMALLDKPMSASGGSANLNP